MNEIMTNQDAKGGKTKTLYWVCGLLMVIILGLDLAIPLGVAVGVFYMVVVFLSLWAPRQGFTLVVALLASILTVGCFFYKPPAGELWKVVFNRGISLIAIWVTAFLGLQRKKAEERREEAVREREKALEDLKILRGSLPICSSCKRILSNAGSWTQLEAYIREHSEADFSHGLCPECARKAYQAILEGKDPDAVF